MIHLNIDSSISYEGASDDDCSASVRRLRELAAWYRAFAERAGNPAIWDARLRTAEDLDAEASRIEQRTSAQSRPRHVERTHEPQTSYTDLAPAICATATGSMSRSTAPRRSPGW